MEHTSSHRLVKDIFYSAVKSVDPHETVKLYGDRILSTYERTGCNRSLLIGFGKAVCPMAKAAEEALPGLIREGMAITKYGHCPSSYYTGNLRIIEAGHPLPDENGLTGTKEIITLLKGVDKKTLIVCLISGGGSSLLVAPCEGLSLDEKQKITALLLNAGANIHELNTVRKHLSQVKGGRLAEIARPAPVISLILSDVIGDRLDVIASGPTAPDRTTYEDALSVLGKYTLMETVPENALDILSRGARGMIPETPKENTVIFEKVQNIIVGNNKKALGAAEAKAHEIGLHAEIISSEVTGEAREAGKWLAKVALEARAVCERDRNRKICLISGGETTVTVRGTGVGGRNTELALAFALEIAGTSGITLLSAGTDGTDGSTDAAGALVDGETVRRARTAMLDPITYLMNNDSYNFFRQTGGLFTTGPTGTNVMDIQIMFIE